MEADNIESKPKKKIIKKIIRKKIVKLDTSEEEKSTDQQTQNENKKSFTLKELVADKFSLEEIVQKMNKPENLIKFQLKTLLYDSSDNIKNLANQLLRPESQPQPEPELQQQKPINTDCPDMQKLCTDVELQNMINIFMFLNQVKSDDQNGELTKLCEKLKHNCIEKILK